MRLIGNFCTGRIQLFFKVQCFFLLFDPVEDIFRFSLLLVKDSFASVYQFLNLSICLLGCCSSDGLGDVGGNKSRVYITRPNCA